MKDWKHCTKNEIEEMTFVEAVEIIQKQIALGYTKGEYKPRNHMTKALEIVLTKALENNN